MVTQVSNMFNLVNPYLKFDSKQKETSSSKNSRNIYVLTKTEGSSLFPRATT